MACALLKSASCNVIIIGDEHVKTKKGYVTKAII